MLRLRIAAWTAAGMLCAGAAIAQNEKVAVSALAFVSSAPIFIAQDKGYFAAEKLDVEFKIMQAAQPVALAVASGDAQLGITGLTGGFYNLAGKDSVRIIASQAREEPGWNFVGFVASNKAFEAGLTSVEQLRGKVIGHTTAGSTFHYVFGRLFEQRGWRLDEAQLRALQTVPNMYAAVKGGQVDAIQAPANVANAMHAAGEGKLIGWVHQYVPWQLGALFTSPKMIAEKRPVVEGFIRAYVKATADYDAAFQRKGADGQRVFGAGSDELIAILQKYTKSEPAIIRASLPYIDPQGRLKVKDIHDQIAWNKANKLVDEAVDPRKVVDLSFIRGHFDVPAN
ncbi:MAG: transporter substrate-binding domain-containing protein [Alphaproteobacteria bacterium]|nr:transporter substrate-binding domain-containing protein [Alphaproteobacteria bacterium]